MIHVKANDKNRRNYHNWIEGIKEDNLLILLKDVQWKGCGPEA
jgi:hypothetical protein